MKFVLVLIAVAALLWLLRRGLRGASPSRRVRPDRPVPKAMLSCAQCGVHLPRDEALPGRGGMFCDVAHREAFEKAHPDA